MWIRIRDSCLDERDFPAVLRLEMDLHAMALQSSIVAVSHLSATQGLREV